ncbi:MAG: hypothetical protein NT009_09390 [Proteobacteria bacterium]|nr:hypothetical protein [Pseudomonadota bacterium]
MKTTKKKSETKKKTGEKKTGEKKTEKKKTPASAPAFVPASGGADPNLICPICAGKIRVKVAFSNIYCGYHLVPSCPGNCKWPDEYRYDLMQRITELHYEHPELFETDAELTEESLALERDQNR